MRASHLMNRCITQYSRHELFVKWNSSDGNKFTVHSEFGVDFTHILHFWHSSFFFLALLQCNYTFFLLYNSIFCYVRILYNC